MRSSIVTVEDFKNNTVQQFTKQKPENPDVRGFCTVELYDAETGEIEHRVVAENVYKDAQAQQAYSVALINSGFMSRSSNFIQSEPLKEVHLLYDASRTESTKSVIRGEGKFIGWANVQSDYGGSDATQGNRNKQISSSRIDPDTGELVYRMGWLFDQTRINNQPVNKIALTAYQFNGEQKFNTHYVESALNGQTHRYDFDPKSNADLSYQMDIDHSVFRTIYLDKSDKNFVRLHKMSGNLLTTVPVTYNQPGQNKYLLQLTNITELDSQGIINHKYLLDLGTLGSVLKYNESCSYVLDCKTNKLYITSYVDSTGKITVMEYFIDPAQINKTPGVSTTFTPTTTKELTLTTKPTLNPTITPVIDYSTGTVEIVYQTVGGISILRLDSSLNIGSTVSSNFSFKPMEVSKVDVDTYFIIRDKGEYFCRNSVNGGTLIGGFHELSTNRYVETMRVAPYWDNSHDNPRYHNTLSFTTNNAAGSYSFFDSRSGNVLQAIYNSTTVKGQFRWIMPVSHVPPSPYLFVDVIPEFTKSASQSMKITYEIRVPMNMNKMTSPFLAYNDFSNNSMLMPVGGKTTEFSPTVLMPWIKYPLQTFEPSNVFGSSIYYGRSGRFSTDKSVMVIGAWNERKTGSTATTGGVYVYRWNTTSNKYVLEQYISGIVTTSYFGWSVDINGAGTRIVIGAPNENRGSSYNGQVYISEYDSVTTTWAAATPGVDWGNTPSATYNSYSRSMALSKDGTTLVLGTTQDGVESTSSNYGTIPIVCVWDAATSKYVYKMQLNSPTVPFNSKTLPGYATAISNDGATIAVGYPLEDAYSDNSGLVQVWTRTATDVWSQQFVTGHSTTVQARFGNDIKLSGDGNNMIVGAFNISTVYFYKRTGTNWVLNSKFSTEKNSQLGFGVSISEDGTRAVASLRYGSAMSIYEDGAILYRYNTTAGVWQEIGYASCDYGQYVEMTRDGNAIVLYSDYDDNISTGTAYSNVGRASYVDVSGLYAGLTDTSPTFKIR